MSFRLEKIIGRGVRDKRRELLPLTSPNTRKKAFVLLVCGEDTERQRLFLLRSQQSGSRHNERQVTERAELQPSSPRGPLTSEAVSRSRWVLTTALMIPIWKWLSHISRFLWKVAQSFGFL